MSRTETAKLSANALTQPQQQRAKSTAEAQLRLIERLDQLASDQARLAEEQRTSALQLAAALKASGKSATEGIEAAKSETETILSRAATTIMRAEEGVATAEKAAKLASERAARASTQLEKQAGRLRWTVIALAAASGLVIGILLLIALLVLQPVLIQKLYTIAQTIR